MSVNVTKSEYIPLMLGGAALSVSGINTVIGGIDSVSNNAASNFLTTIFNSPDRLDIALAVAGAAATGIFLYHNNQPTLS